MSSPEAAPELRIVLIVEEVDGGGHGWGSKDPRLGRVLPSPWLAGAGTRDKGCSGLIPWASLNKDTLSVVVHASSTSMPFIDLLLHSRPLRMSPHSKPQSSAWLCSPNPTFQHPALVCSGALSGWCPLSPLRLGGQGWGQQPVYRSHCVLLPQTVAVFSSHRE